MWLKSVYNIYWRHFSEVIFSFFLLGSQRKAHHRSFLFLWVSSFYIREINNEEFSKRENFPKEREWGTLSTCYFRYIHPLFRCDKMFFKISIQKIPYLASREDDLLYSLKNFCVMHYQMCVAKNWKNQVEFYY